jgi:hypothetical protein
MFYAAETCSRFGFVITKVVYRRVMFLFCITQEMDDVTLEGYDRTFETIFYLSHPLRETKVIRH